ncbi:MAG: hypothetical protein ACOCVM_07665 [Desulfovibrionaceae bacterium]
MNKKHAFSEDFISASKGAMQENPSFRDELQQAIALAGSDLFGELRTKRARKKMPAKDSKDYKVW